jgi:hypothetical protein
MKTDDILRRTPTALRPIIQVVLERIDELDATVADQAKQIAALKKASKVLEPKAEKPKAKEPEAT